MKYQTVLHEKTVRVELSGRAEKALQRRDQPVTAVVHLIFGCMVAKRVWFKDQVKLETASVTNKLDIAFNVVRYAVCSFENIDGGVEPETFPLAKDIKGYVPDYLFIDYHKQQFTGDFTYERASVMVEATADDHGSNQTIPVTSDA